VLVQYLSDTDSIHQKPTALVLPHGVVFAEYIEQLLMRSLFYDFAFFQYDYAIHV
jgi:hypothetical protein